jgi:hypothetical protein
MKLWANVRLWEVLCRSEETIELQSDAEVLANGCNLDRKNPRAKEDITHLPPARLAADVLKKEQRIAEIMGTIQKLLAKSGT